MRFWTRCALMTLCATCATYGTPLTAPAHALLGEDHLMVTSYYSAPSRWPPEMKERLDQYAKAQRELRPQIVQLFKNDDNHIRKEVWVAQGSLWSFAEAHQIRQAIMQNRRIRTSYLTKNQQVFLYPDGSRVYVQFNPRNYRVHTVWAVDKATSEERGDKMPESFWKNTRTYYPVEQ